MPAVRRATATAKAQEPGRDALRASGQAGGVKIEGLVYGHDMMTIDTLIGLWRRGGMKTMAAGKFKARCLSVMDDVRATGEPVVITKRGAPVVKVVPVAGDGDELFGFMEGEFKITGDIESPVTPLSAWKVMKK